MEERERRDKMLAQLLSMDMREDWSKEAAEIGVGNIEIAIDFCDDGQTGHETRERVRREAQKVVQKTGLRSQRAKAASLRGLSAPAPADLVGNAAMGPRSSMALVVASTSTADSDAEENADEESAPLSARAVNVSAVGKRGAAEEEEMRLDGALPRPCMHCPRHHSIRKRHAHATGDKSYTFAEFVAYYGDEANAEWARAGRGVDAARSTPKKPKLKAAGASGAASGWSARAGAARDARSLAPAHGPTPPVSASAGGDGVGDSGGGGGGGSDVEKWEGKLMKHLGQVRRYLEKLQAQDATRAQD